MADDAPLQKRARGRPPRRPPQFEPTSPSAAEAAPAAAGPAPGPSTEPPPAAAPVSPEPQRDSTVEPKPSATKPAGPDAVNDEAITGQSGSASAAATAGAAAGAALSAPADDETHRILSGPPPGKPRALPRRRFVDDMPDRGRFIVYVVLGFIAIFVLKTQGFPATLVTGLAVAAMVIYGISAYRLPAVRLRPDRLGDNFYYMGFIFTLASMSAALVQLDTASRVDVDRLISTFGIALFTTIAGIAGRVAFVQMREDLDDTEERARHDILEAYTKLKSSMGAAVVEFEAFRMGVQNVLHDRLQASLDRFTTAADSQVARVGAAAASVIESVQKASTTSFDHAQNLTKAAQQTAATAERLYREIEAIKVPPDIMERKLDAVVSRIEAAAAAFGKTAEQDLARQQALTGLGENFRSLVASLKDELPKLQGTVSAVAAAAEPAKALGASLEAMRESMAALAQGIADHNAAVASAGRSARETQEQIAADLARSRAAVMEVQQAIAETAHVVADYLGRAPELR
jgi:hypothetical protein